MAPLRIIQISDTHLFSNPDKTLVGVPTQKSLAAVLDVIKRKAGQFDMMIHSGDLAQDYAPSSYTCLAEMLSDFNVPVYCIPGNHDDPAVMADVYPCQRISKERHIVTDHWQIILLNTHKPHAVEGYLDAGELTFLEECLSQHPAHHAAIVFHHQPVPVGSRWLDKLGLTNAADFWKIISNYPKVQLVLFGHVHQEFEQVVNGIKCYSTPSTCFQFMRKQDEFGIENIPPGFRLIELYDDGRIETAVVHAEHYVGKFDTHCKGY
jgi:Icc protein